MEEERVQDADGRNNQYFFIFSSLCGDRFEKEESSDVAAVGRKSRSSFDQFVEYQAESISDISGGCSGNRSGDNKLDHKRSCGLWRCMDHHSFGDLPRNLGYRHLGMHCVLFQQYCRSGMSGLEKISEGYEDSVCSFSYSSICGGGFFMRMKASATIEAAVACSVFFLSFFLVIRGVFYYHDKNILMGTAYEAAVVHSQKKRSPEACTIAEAEQSFEVAARKRMLLFSAVNLTIEETDQKITVQGIAWKGRMKISVSQSAAVTEPEKFIRKMRKAGIHEDGG